MSASGSNATTQISEDTGTADLDTANMIDCLVDEASTNSPVTAIISSANNSQFTPNSSLQQVNIQTYVGGAPTDQVTVCVFLIGSDAKLAVEIFL